MPEFSYSAFRADGQKVKGSITAASKREALAILERQDFFIERLSNPLLILERTARVHEKVFLQFNKEVSSLLRAGLPLVESLSVVANRSDDRTFGAILQQVIGLVKEGSSFADACARYPHIFDDIYISNLKTGEKSGSLHHALSEYQKYLHQKIQFKSKLKKAIAYPLFLVVTLILVLSFLFVFIVPSFAELFDSFNAELPLATRIVMSGAQNFPYLAALVIGSAGILYALLHIGRDQDDVNHRIDRIKTKVPLFGRIIKNARYIQLTRNISTMLAAGMPLLMALENMQAIYRKTAFGQTLEAVTEDVMNGSSLHQALASHQLLSEQAIKLIEVGESSGDLEQMLSEVGDYFENELDDRLSIIMSLFEPALMLLIGFMVGGIIVSMYLPIFYLAEIVK